MRTDAYINRWYTRSSQCVDDTSIIKAAKSQLRIAVFKEIVAREYVMDHERPLEEFTQNLADNRVLIIASVGVIITEEQDLEWRIEDSLKELIDLDDRLNGCWLRDADAHSYATEDEWREALEVRIADIESEIAHLRQQRKW